MVHDLKVLIFEPDKGIASELVHRLEELGLENCQIVSYIGSIQQLKDKNSGLAVLGPTMDAEACHRCIHILKIIEPSIPILIYSDDCLPLDLGWGPFEGVYYLEPGLHKRNISDALETILRNNAERQMSAELPVITEKKDAPTDAKEWEGIKGKTKYLER